MTFKETAVCTNCFWRTNDEDLRPTGECRWCANDEFRPASSVHPEDIAEEFSE